MTIYNSAHAGSGLRAYSGAGQAIEAARRLRVARSTLSRLLNGLARARVHRPSRYAVCILSAPLLSGLCACSMHDARSALKKLTAQDEQSTESAQPAKAAKAAKPASHAKAPEPMPEPTQQELVEYLRGRLLALSPSDGINDNLEVKFDPSASVLTVIQPDGRCDQFLGSLDSNNLFWDIFDPSDAHNSREELLRLTVTSVSGKTARACFDEKGRPDGEASTNRARLLFSLAKSEQIPGFQNKMEKVVKKLIILSGGVQEKQIFPDSRGSPGSENR
jgi:hypothetical protein